MFLRHLNVFASQMAKHRLIVEIFFPLVSFAVNTTAATVYGCWLSTTHYDSDCRPLRVSTPEIQIWQCRVAVDQGIFSGLSFLHGTVHRVKSVQNVPFLRQLERTRRPPILQFRLPHVCFGEAPPRVRYIIASSLHYRSDFRGFLTADRTKLVIRDQHLRISSLQVCAAKLHAGLVRSFTSASILLACSGSFNFRDNFHP